MYRSVVVANCQTDMTLFIAVSRAQISLPRFVKIAVCPWTAQRFKSGGAMRGFAIIIATWTKN